MKTKRRFVFNTEDRTLALVQKMCVGDLHVGDDPLCALANALTKAFRNGDMSIGQG